MYKFFRISESPFPHPFLLRERGLPVNRICFSNCPDPDRFVINASVSGQTLFDVLKQGRGSPEFRNKVALFPPGGQELPA